jgi:hypothetical protein
LLPLATENEAPANAVYGPVKCSLCPQLTITPYMPVSPPVMKLTIIATDHSGLSIREKKC